MGNRTAMTDATGPTIYGYDGLNRLTQIQNPNSQIVITSTTRPAIAPN
jgi:YD repeat-containing protein